MNRIFDVIDEARAGYQVMNRDSESVVIRDCENNVDYRVKVEEIAS